MAVQMGGALRGGAGGRTWEESRRELLIIDGCRSMSALPQQAGGAV